MLVDYSFSAVPLVSVCQSKCDICYDIVDTGAEVFLTAYGAKLCPSCYDDKMAKIDAASIVREAIYRARCKAH